MLSRAQKAVAGMASTKSLKMVLKIVESTPDIFLGDRLRLEHVVVNFLEQAIKNSPPGASVTTTVSCAKPENSTAVRNVSLSSRRREPAVIVDQSQTTFRISIGDLGPSIPAAELENLFIPFQQLRPEEMQRSQGTGLGLSLARDIIELHGGTMTYHCTAPAASPGEENSSAGIEMVNIFCIDLPYEPVPSDLLPLPLQANANLGRIPETSSSASGSKNRSPSATGGVKSLNCLIVDGEHVCAMQFIF